MKTTLTTSQIADALKQDSNAAWSYAGARALAEYLEQLEEDTGEEMELDVVAIRCDFSEYASLKDWALEYFGGDERAAKEFNCKPEELEDYQDKIRDYIQDRGPLLIEFSGGIIVSSF